MWHPHCFKCCVCHTPLETSNFYEKNGKPYCEKHYHELLPKCAGCKQPITDVSKFNIPKDDYFKVLLMFDLMIL